MFLGGGTPTTLEVGGSEALLARLRSSFAVTFDAEVTIEANPDTVDEAEARRAARGRLRAALDGRAVVRSLRCWRSLERVHQPEAVRRAFAAARDAGFENVSMDLIYGAARGERGVVGTNPQGGDRAGARARERVRAHDRAGDLARPCRWHKATCPPPDPDVQADMFEAACVVLGDAGYGHYEVSNWAKPGYECRHNLGYWERRPYVGLGAGAHAYRDGRRWWNVRPPEEYLSMVERGELPVGGSEELEPADAYLEEVFLRLRILEGIPASWIEDGRADPYLESGLLLDDDGNLVPTERGMLLLNELVLGLTG